MPSEKIVAPHLFVATGTATAKGTFYDAGKLERASFRPNVQKREVVKWWPDIRRRTNVLVSGFTLDWNASVSEAGILLLQLVFGTADLTGSLGAGLTDQQFNPSEGKGAFKGWFKFQVYDETYDPATQTSPWNTVDLFSSVTISNWDLDDNLLSYELEGQMIESTLNTGQVASL